MKHPAQREKIRYFPNKFGRDRWAEQAGMVRSWDPVHALKDWFRDHGILQVRTHVYGTREPSYVIYVRRWVVDAFVLVEGDLEAFKALVLRARYSVDLRKSISLQVALRPKPGER